MTLRSASVSTTSRIEYHFRVNMIRPPSRFPERVQRQGGHVAPGTFDPLEGQRARGHEQRLGAHLPQTDPQQQAGERRDQDSDGQDDLQAANHLRECEAAHHNVIEANRPIMCGQRRLAVERAECAMTEQQQAGREAQDPVYHPRPVDGEWRHGGRPHSV